MTDKIGMDGEIPAAVREAAEKSISEARKAVERMLDMTRDNMTAAEARGASIRADGQAISQKVMTFTQANIQSAFDLAERMARAKSVEEMMRLQAEYAARQASNASQQAQELGSAGARLTESMIKPRG
ncbi:hypothetical protein GCM10007276_09200 [Agaricicola taiwanensis]|uniref:Phasin domain-containing protein n=1 Tax=Agaricicola taiwanensis TaxID=591372 RepID=A0A8J2VKB7_9RHOB|nr:phasin family protein [Agaricicola taiwanensis]GGE34001.1 hypothetical protein GCM10007276_09200 [Agaricicola taiwanensis]